MKLLFQSGKLVNNAKNGNIKTQPQGATQKYEDKYQVNQLEIETSFLWGVESRSGRAQNSAHHSKPGRTGTLSKAHIQL